MFNYTMLAVIKLIITAMITVAAVYQLYARLLLDAYLTVLIHAASN